MKEPKGAGLKKNSDGVQKFLDELVKIGKISFILVIIFFILLYVISLPLGKSSALLFYFKVYQFILNEMIYHHTNI